MYVHGDEDDGEKKRHPVDQIEWDLTFEASIVKLSLIFTLTM